MKKHIITALLITTMISMTACGGKNNTDTPAEETVVATSESVENPTANDEKVVLGTVNKEETATVETTADAKTDAKATATPDPKATEAPKSTAAPETTAKPKSTEAPKATTTPKTSTQANATATTKPAATEKPKSTTAPKATATPAPKATAAPKATETPKATPAPTAAPVACQHTNYHIENSHDTENVPIAGGGCYDVYNYSTKVCNDCGYSFGEARNKVNTVHHGCVISEGVSATCTTDGRTAVESCDCGGLGTTGGDVIPAFGHDYKDEWDHDETDAEGKDHVYFHSICRNCGDISSVWEE